MICEENIEKIKKAVEELLVAIGEDPSREGLRDTPDRVARMYCELTSGYDEDASETLSKTFDVKGGEFVLERDITFSSMCEHHLMPFFGKAHIAYIPDGKVAGLSKLARTVDIFARRLQLQERLNAQIADAVYMTLGAKGVMVLIEAEHTCMTARGVKKAGSKTVSLEVRGDFPARLQAQVMSILSR